MTAFVHVLVGDGANQRLVPVKGTDNGDGTGSIGGGGGGSVTAPGTAGTQAQAVQGVPGGVPMPTRSSTVATAPTSRVAASATSVQLLAANAARQRVVIVNDSESATLRIKFGTTASAVDFTYLLNPGDTYESPDGVIYTGRIDGIWSAAVGAAQITEM